MRALAAESSSRWSTLLVRRGPLAWLAGLLALAPTVAAAQDQAQKPAETPVHWRAGVAQAVITPGESMWMAGYAARREPSAGKVHDLHAKALVLEDGAGKRFALLTLDLISVPRTLRERLVEAAGEHNIPAAGLLINASHTHCGPELRADKSPIYGVNESERAKIRSYSQWLETRLIQLLADGVQALRPADLAYSRARAGFAMNRRLPTPAGIQNRPYADGPVDHEVPVLEVRQGEQLAAVVFGYACHNTTLGFQKFCGDYAGFAQEYLEAAHPGATALFVTGCGGDQNPQPRRTLELAQQHGRTLANAVEAALISPRQTLRGPLRYALAEVPLAFSSAPTRGELEKRLQSRNPYEQRHAELLLQQLDEQGQLPESYPYLAQLIRFGEDLVLVALAGEVVVDYSLRLKAELDAPRVWVAGYSNDVFAYIPSLRVLEEGGYEGGGAMTYTRLPGPWAPTVERTILTAVRELDEKTREVAGETLFVATPLTTPGQFTTGIEGPACDAAGNVLAVNFARQGTIGLTTPQGESRLLAELPKGSIGNGIRFDGQGLAYIADYTRHNILRLDPASGKIDVFAHHAGMHQPNDLAIAADGTLYASDPNWAGGDGQLWRIDPSGAVQQLASGLGTTNGIEVSPDGQTLYVNESVQRKIWAFPITPQGLGPRRLVKQFPDHGFDGMRCDVDGNLYVTRHGKGTVVKLTPRGELLREIPVLGTKPSNLCFGGPDGRTVYVTEVDHQRLVQFRVDRPGLAWQRWQSAAR